MLTVPVSAANCICSRARVVASRAMLPGRVAWVRMKSLSRFDDAVVAISRTTK
jgi:hypothetical protein